MNTAATFLRGRTGAVAVGVLMAAVGAAAGLLAGMWISDGDNRSVPADSSIDAGFLRSMQDHHAQAVQMSTLVRDAVDDEQVRALALEVALTQQQQIGQMHGWLASWGLPQSSGSSLMAWMAAAGAAHSMGGMPGPTAQAATMLGMATEAEVQQLARANGEEAERLYLQLMIPHHRGGVTMANVAASSAARPEVRRLAQTIVDSQKAEIAVLEQMLSVRGGTVPPP